MPRPTDFEFRIFHPPAFFQSRRFPNRRRYENDPEGGPRPTPRVPTNCGSGVGWALAHLEFLQVAWIAESTERAIAAIASSVSLPEEKAITET